MKRKFAILLALLMVLSALPVVLGAESSEEWVVLYRLSEDPAFTDAEVGSEFNIDGHQFLSGTESSTITVEEDAEQAHRLQVVTDHEEDAWATGGLTIPLAGLELGTSIMIRGRIDAVLDEDSWVGLQRDHAPFPAPLLRGEMDIYEGFEFQYNIVLNEFNLEPAEGFEHIPPSFTIRPVFGIATFSITEIEILAPPEPETEPEPEPAYTVMQFTIGSTTWTEDGVTRTLEAAPFMSGNRAMVPLRFVAEALGADVDLLRGTPRVVVIELDDIELRLSVGVALPDDMGTPVIVGGRVFVPIGYVSDVLGASTRWCDDTQSVYVYVPAE